ncbi:hypothetical protein CANINC_001203 [Pichia inconspicua]|uniref:Ras-associating domain-containing protein n=1 Tax=Pichia inconspicua TaxID=52247 RepID=A0A4T0X448_9ASCO|nr:hypothetical protein CANINC_001203 [[Candida] inconspicua]
MLSWKTDQVLLFLKNKGYPDDILAKFREHNITGLVLPMLNTLELKEMGIDQLKTRLKILNDINSLILEKGETRIATDEHPMVSELLSKELAKELAKNISESITQDALKRQQNRDDEFHTLSVKVNKLREEVLPILKEIQDSKPLPSPAESNGRANASKPKLGHRSSSHNTAPSSPVKKSTSSNSPDSVSNDTLKQLRAKSEDPCYKILQAAMKSHKLDKSEWRKYVLVICYGGDKERVLRYDEKPVHVFKELNELGLSPSIMLRQVDENDVTGNIIQKNDYETPGGRL